MNNAKENRKWWKRLFDRFVMWWKVKYCRHVFRGSDLQLRDANGNVHWPCSKCGKMFIEPYGLKMEDYGQLRNSALNITN